MRLRNIVQRGRVSTATVVSGPVATRRLASNTRDEITRFFRRHGTCSGDLAMRLLLATVISISFAACNTTSPTLGPVGRAVARITQVPNDVGCVTITAVGDRTVTGTFDVFGGQSATMQMNDLPVGNVAFSAAAYRESCGAIAGAQTGWATPYPFYAPITAGAVTSLTLTLEPTGGAVIGIDFGGDGGNPG